MSWQDLQRCRGHVQLLLVRRHQNQLGIHGLGNLAFRSAIPLCQTKFGRFIDPFWGTHDKKRGERERERERNSPVSQGKEMLEIHRRNSGSGDGLKSLGVQDNKVVTCFVLSEAIF